MILILTQILAGVGLIDSYPRVVLVLLQLGRLLRVGYPIFLLLPRRLLIVLRWIELLGA